MDRQIGKTRTTLNSDSVTTCQAQFLVDEAHLAAYILPVGTTGMSYFPTGIPYSGYTKVEAGTNYWLITITGTDKGGGSFAPISSKDLLTKKSYGEIGFQFDKAHFGLKNALASDITNEVYKFGTGELATEGELVFLNATADDPGGTAVYTASPFGTNSMEHCFGGEDDVDRNLILGVLYTSVILQTYTVEYFDSRYAPSWFRTYKGLLTTASSVPSEYQPSGFSSGEWRTNGQSMKSTSYQGASAYVVTRNMVRAPEIDGTQLIWASTTIGIAEW